MLERQSPLYLTRQLDNQVGRALAKVDLRAISRAERDLITTLQQEIHDAKTYISAYELSETRAEQEENAKAAKKWLNKVRKQVLALSEHDYFNPVDVAHLTAQIETICKYLR